MTSNPVPEYVVEILDSGASFSDDLQYRYDLWRVWDLAKPVRLWIMLNPSTADEVENDPTVERCFRRTVADGFGGMAVCNIFALRSTDPRALYQHNDPIGPENDEFILTQARDVMGDDQSGQIVCAWGGHGELNDRGNQVMELLRKEGMRLHALKMTKRGQPNHPLYVAYHFKPVMILPSGS